MKVSAIAASLVVFTLATTTGATLYAQAAAQPPKPAQPAQTPAQPPVQPAATLPPQPPAPFPAGAKLAFVNPQRIFQESTEGKVALTRVKALTDKKQTENNERQKALQANQQKLSSGGSVLSDAARSTLEKEIERQQLDLQRFQQDAQAEINELQTEVQGEFARKVQPILDQIAKEKGLQMLFDASNAGFAWVDPGLDLSAEVIKKLDAGKPGTAKP